MEDIVRTTVKGQIVIPAKIRKKYHISKGTRLKVEDRDEFIAVVPLLEEPVKQARGIAKGKRSALRVLLADRKEEARR
jgi:AbrB family looped-hinge helix DNA binding protein